MLILLHGEHILKLNFDNDVIKICIINWFFLASLQVFNWGRNCECSFSFKSAKLCYMKSLVI